MHYEQLVDEELLRLTRTDLVPQARAQLLDELQVRGLSLPADPAADPAVSGNLYAGPRATLADTPREPAVVTLPGLVHMFRLMVVSSTVIGCFLALWGFLPVHYPPEIASIRNLSGAGALFPKLSETVYYVSQGLYVLAGFGLYFFVWWSRYLLAGLYIIGFLNTLAWGMVVSHGWEHVLASSTAMLDGATIALSFLPPLSKYFEHGRT